MSIDTLRKWLGTAAPSPHDTELRRAVRDALIEYDALAHEARHSVGVYEILKDFDVYGTGGDATSCAREAKQRVIDLMSAVDGLYGSIELDRAAWAEARKALEQQAAAAVTAEAQAVKRADELEAALRGINNCIIWSDTAQEWYLAGRVTTFPALELVRTAIAPRAPEPEAQPDALPDGTYECPTCFEPVKRKGDVCAHCYGEGHRP